MTVATSAVMMQQEKYQRLYTGCVHPHPNGEVWLQAWPSSKPTTKFICYLFMYIYVYKHKHVWICGEVQEQRHRHMHRIIN